MSQSVRVPGSRGNSGPAQNVVAPSDANAEDAVSDSRAAMQIWTGRAIDDQIHSRSLGNAYRQWRDHKANRQLQSWDVYSTETNSFDDTLLTLKVGDQHIDVSQSDNHIRAVRRDLQGTLSSELKVATASRFRDIFDDCLAKKHPVYARYISSLSEENVYSEILVLPLGVDARSEPIFTMSYMAMLNEKIDIL